MTSDHFDYQIANNHVVRQARQPQPRVSARQEGSMILQPTSVTQAIRNELRRICQTEQTEAHVLAVLCERPDDFVNGNYCPAIVNHWTPGDVA
jgi:hypothetical protein